jgi:sugar O-acyltransferase (sialic acid O-acetyltransferase NeuD family)
MGLRKNLIIISAGALGREVRDLAAGIETEQGEKCPWRLKGFLDDRDLSPGGIPILGSPASYEPKKSDVFICAIGDPVQRTKYSSILRERGGQFVVMVEPSSKIGGRTDLGSGCVVGPFCVLSCDVKAGEDTIITSHVTVGHDVRLGSSCHVGAHVFLGGGVVVGNQVTIHPHATLLPGVRIGDGATIGAGSVVMRSVSEWLTVFGMPAMSVSE